MKGQSKYNCNDNDTVHVLYMYQDTISNDKLKNPQDFSLVVLTIMNNYNE